MHTAQLAYSKTEADACWGVLRAVAVQHRFYIPAIQLNPPVQGLLLLGHPEEPCVAPCPEPLRELLLCDWPTTVCKGSSSGSKLLCCMKVAVSCYVWVSVLYLWIAEPSSLIGSRALWFFLFISSERTTCQLTWSVLTAVGFSLYFLLDVSPWSSLGISCLHKSAEILVSY